MSTHHSSMAAGSCRSRTTRRDQAFTLVEILLVMAAVAILSGAAIVAVGNARESTRVGKLESDVATINAAIQAYLVNGGSLPVSATPQQILARLKTTADATSAPTIPGLRGSFVDRRLTTDMQTAGEAGTTQTRALWDGANRRFVIMASGAAGVKNFRLDDTIGGNDFGTETRTPPLKVADDGWVWDYADVSGGTPAGPGGAPGTTTVTPGTPPTAPTAQQLAAPAFSQTGGSFALINFDFPLTLSNPNPPGTSQIFFTVNGGPFALYQGQTLTVTPTTAITAYAATSDPDRWTDSNIAAHTYQATPVALSISLNVPVATLTYAQAGGQMTSGSVQSPAPATVTLNSAAEIPAAYLSSARFQVYSTVDGTNPLLGGDAGPTFAGTFTSPAIDLSLPRWGSASVLSVSAAARSLAPALFVSSPVVSATVGITPTALPAPVIDPPSGSKAVDLPVSIALAANQVQPVGARIYYTTNGTDPGVSGGEPVGGTLYSGQFNAGAGVNNVVTVRARVYGPAGYGHWFTPSAITTNTYSSVTLADGALVGSANLNGTFVGSLVYASPPAGSNMNSITFNSGARIIGGNLYLPGTPTIRLSNGTTWSAANDALFAARIQGWEYDSNGNKTVQTTPRVINENGSVNPTNYTVSFNNSALLEGKVIRRHDSPAFPVIAAPPPPDGTGTGSFNSPPPGVITSSQYANITLNSAPVGDVRLRSGNYGNLIANNGTAFVLGDPNNPEVTQFYSFQSLTLNSASDVKIVGKVIVTVGGTITINSGSILGNASRPEWFQMQFSAGSLNANSGSTIYGQLVAPNGTVSFNAGSVFTGSVTAQTLTINSSSIVFNLPPVIQN